MTDEVTAAEGQSELREQLNVEQRFTCTYMYAQRQFPEIPRNTAKEGG